MNNIYNLLAETNWFDCNEDILDFMDYIKGSKDPVEKSKEWFEDVYDNVINGEDVSEKDLETKLNNLFKEVCYE